MTLGCSLKDYGTLHVQGTPARFGFEEGNRYTVTVVKAVNPAGSSEPSNTVTAMTEEKGEKKTFLYLLCLIIAALHSPLRSSRISG